MKKTIILLLTTITVLFSCKDFLDEEMVTKIGYPYYETEEGAEAAVNACYHTLRNKVGNEWCYGLFNFGTDEIMKGQQWGEPYAWNEYNDYLDELDGRTIEGSPQDINDWWVIEYEGINICNTAINAIPQVTDGVGVMKDEVGKNKRLAEAKFIRAWHYFQLVQQFGALPVSLEPTTQAKFEWPRVPASEVYDIILDDLEFAYNNLADDDNTEQYGRVTKDAVRHYWAKVLLTRNSSDYNAADEARNFDLGGNGNADLTKAAELIEEIKTHGQHYLLDDYAKVFEEGNEKNPEIIFSIQYNQTVGLNESQGSYQSNTCHLYWGLRYDVDEPGMERYVEYDIPFRRMMLTDYAIDVHDRLNDSRLRKSVGEVFRSTSTTNSAIPAWTKAEIGFAFGIDGDMAADSSWAIRYGDTIKVGQKKFNCATATTSEVYVDLGDTALVFLINDENTTLTDRQIIAMGYKVYARYYWATDESGTPTELVTWDRTDDLLNTSDRNSVVSSAIKTYTWNRDKGPGVSKYRDGQRIDKGSYLGTRDIFLARVSESYLIAAEAYGRLGNYGKAVEFINYVRRRAGYAAGEEKPNFWLKFDGGTAADLTASTKDNMAISEGYWNTDPDELASYPPGVSTDQERFIAFILNERCREFLGEMKRWEDLKRTETLIDRAYTFNDDVRNAGFLQDFHRVRPLPQAHLNTIKSEETGTFLTPTEKKAYQNNHYY